MRKISSINESIDEKEFWKEKPISEGYVSVQYFFKWLVGKDIYKVNVQNDVFESIMQRGFDRYFNDIESLKSFLMKFDSYWHIRIYTFRNENIETNTEYPYTLKINGLTKWDWEHPKEERYNFNEILSKKRLSKKDW